MVSFGGVCGVGRLGELDSVCLVLLSCGDDEGVMEMIRKSVSALNN